MNIFKSFVFLLLILFFNISMVKSQPIDTGNSQNNISPPVAIVIVLLVAAVFFAGFITIYVRECTSTTSSSDATANNNVRNAIAAARRANRIGVAHGLDASVIETFPTFSYTEVKDHKIGRGVLECAVCLNEFGDDETLRFIPKCDHVFHPECIDAWLEHHVTCPVCRTDLTPQPEDEPYQLPVSNPPENNNSTEISDDVAVDVDLQEEQVAVIPVVNRIWSLKILNRPPRTESVKRGKENMLGSGKFRSHSTGHSLVQPGENMDRFTLILPQEIRKEMINRALLNRTKSVATVFPRERSTMRRWYSTRFEQPDRLTDSDRRLPFFSRAKSGKQTKVVEEKGEASTFSMVKLPSLKCLEPKSVDEMSLMHVEPVQPPV